eukprot:5309402-Pleurochrysis_carterae.AAC.1
MSHKWGHPVATLPVTNGSIRHKFCAACARAHVAFTHAEIINPGSLALALSSSPSGLLSMQQLILNP